MDLKKLTTSFIIALFLLADSFAGEKPENCLLFSIASGNKARLGVINTGDRSVSLEIVNNSGSTFFTKTISVNENYFQMLDLSKMIDGEYKVKLSGSNTDFEKKFEVKNKVATLIVKPKETPPRFQMIDNETLLISYMNPDEKNVSIYFELNNEIVFEELNLSNAQLSKKYSLKKLPKGAYDVKVYSEGKVYNFAIAVK